MKRGVAIKEVGAAEFKAHCLKLMDEVHSTRRALLVKKRGRPIVKLVPADEASRDVFGCLSGTFAVTGDILEPVVPPDVWDVLG